MSVAIALGTDRDLKCLVLTDDVDDNLDIEMSTTLNAAIAEETFMKNAISTLFNRSAAAFVFILLAGLTSPSYAAGSTVRYFKATISPDSVAAGSIATAYSVTITNCDATACPDHATSSSQSMGSATIAVPSGFTNVTVQSASASAGKTWAANLVGGQIQLQASGGTNKLDPGQSVTLSFNANAPCVADPYEWTTAGYQDTPLATNTPYTLYGSQPVVTVTGTCATFTGWNEGDYCTYSQGGWGSGANGNNPGSIRDGHFGGVYPSGLMVGLGHYMLFDSSGNVNDYLPTGGTAGALTMDYTNPEVTTPGVPATTSGVFGGQVLALKLNYDFNAAHVLASTMSAFGDVVLSDDSAGSLNGLSVNEILYKAETALGGSGLPSGYDFSSLNTLVDALNNAFNDCHPSDWAQAHLIPGQ
jgi:hypothetical protein